MKTKIVFAALSGTDSKVSGGQNNNPPMGDQSHHHVCVATNEVKTERKIILVTCNRT